MPALAVEMHINMLKQTLEKPFDTEIQRKNVAVQMEPRTRTPTLPDPAQSIHMSVFYKRWQKSHSIRKLR